MDTNVNFPAVTPPLLGMPAPSGAHTKQRENSTATIVVAVSVTAAVLFVIAVQLFVLWRSARHAAASPSPYRVHGHMLSREGPKGLKKDEINAFPLVKWDPNMAAAASADLESGNSSSATTPLDDYAHGDLALVRCSSSPALPVSAVKSSKRHAHDLEAQQDAAVPAHSSIAEPPAVKLRPRPLSLRHVPRARAWSHQQCSICVEAFVLGDELRVLPCAAEHKFHAECIDRWLLKRSVCPLCRTDFGPLEPAPLVSEGEASGVPAEAGASAGVTLWECEGTTPDAITHAPHDKAPQSPPAAAPRERRDGSDGARPSPLELELELDVAQPAPAAAAPAVTAVAVLSSAPSHAPLVPLPPLAVLPA